MTDVKSICIFSSICLVNKKNPVDKDYVFILTFIRSFYCI